MAKKTNCIGVQILGVLLFLLSSCHKQSIHPQIGEIVEAVYGLGTVESEQVYTAKAALLSYVEEFYVTEGQDVVKGQKLFRLDQGQISKAPFDGRITDLPVSVRENLFPQTRILTLIGLDQLFLSVSLEQQGAMRVKVNQKAEVSFEFFRNNKLKGVVQTIYPVKDQFIAKVALDHWPSGVLPGMTADVAFEVERKQAATLVPIKAIVNNHIRLKREGKKIKIPVEIGSIDLEMAEILSPPLKTDDEILLP